MHSEQNSTRKIPYYTLVIFLIFSCSGLLSIFLFNTDYGSVSVSTISISHDDEILTGWLYRPNDLSASDSLPTVVLAHGLSGSKYTMSGLALEMGRRGFVALALDLSGHGNSDLINEPTMGISAAIAYLGSLPYTNISALGVVGHSMGAGAAFETVKEYQNIAATVLIGPVGLKPNGILLQDFNTTFPRNLLIAIGEYDEFYSDISELNTLLMPIFGTINPVVPNHGFYGNFSTQNARKLVVSGTNHILETADPKILSEIIDWLQNSLKYVGGSDEYYLAPTEIIFAYKEIVSLGTLISLIGLMFPVLFLVYNNPHFSKEKVTSSNDFVSIDLKKSGSLWGTLIIFLIIPTSLIGNFLPFPPLRFGPSIGLWFLVVNVCVLTILTFFPEFFGMKKDIKSLFKTSLSPSKVKNGILLACGLILLLYIFLYFLNSLLSIQLGFVIGIFGDILVPSRIVGFFSFLPIFVVMFLIDGFVFHYLVVPIIDELNLEDEINNLLKILLVKGAPFILVSFIVYFLKIVLGIHLLPPGTFALLFQFFWVIGIFLMLGTVITYLWYRASHSIVPGAVFTALLFAWIFVTILPLG